MLRKICKRSPTRLWKNWRATVSERTFRVWRGNQEDGGEFVDYSVEVQPGMVVLDCIHEIQKEHASDLSCRWNCKAGKCGSCSMEINGKPALSCMTRMNTFEEGETVTLQPMKTFPVIRDLTCDVSWNYEQNKRIRPFAPRPRDPDGEHRMMQEDVDRVQEFRKCIECFLCQDTCHILRDRETEQNFAGPRFMVR
ncbi:MAG: succinate dehydrogenase/fumarate reductase iron-sulfur subunit, partial [Planctomycetes bacterium]|nr:succinate dehydrogenase/fumarate reductase iron-sulfur subunit [Planctomycetota bacterium]